MKNGLNVPFFLTTFLVCVASGVGNFAFAEIWPTKGWDYQSPPALKGPKIEELKQFLFSTAGDKKTSPVTDAALIVHRGKIIFEQYANGYGPEQRHTGWSIAKSVQASLTGIGVKKGKLQTADSVCKFFKPQNADPKFCGITIQSLLTWSSGLKWKEEYEKAYDLSPSSILQAVYGDGRQNMAQFVASHPVENPPETAWRYSSGDTMLLTAVNQNAFGSARFPWTELFDVLGMKSVVWETDGNGVFIGSGYIFATPRDWAKWGYFLLREGAWENQQLLPKSDRGGWIKDSTQVSKAFRTKILDHADSKDVGGTSFWLNRAVPEHRLPQPFPDAPEESFSAEGHWGQFIHVIPSWDVVALRFGNDRKEKFDQNEFLKRVREILP